jgi:hypothetical protein
MPSFFEELWLSVFEPGPTPTLLIATNASFAALQALFIATYSVHFVILSFLTAGLWYAINWFAAEVKAAQVVEEEAKRIREARREKEKDKTRTGDEVEAMDTGDDTEVDAEVEEKFRPKPSPRAPRPETQSTVFVQRPSERSEKRERERERESTPMQTSSGTVGASTTGAATNLAPVVDDALKKRKGMGESTGDISTDSEWDKLSQDSGDR